MERLREVINYININRAGFKLKLNNFGIIKIKMPLIKRFLGEKLKLKRFLT